MALVKSSSKEQQEFRFNSIEECVQTLKEGEPPAKMAAVEMMAQMEGGPKKLSELLGDSSLQKDELSLVGSTLARLDPKQAPVEEIMEQLKSQDAFIRNFAITILQDYGAHIKYYIVKFLIGDDRDLRIFAINVLGDVGFSESRVMMVELLESEQDVNVAMTAVDYLSEIGEEEDIPLLESLKERFRDEPYVTFAIDRTIRVIRG